MLVTERIEKEPYRFGDNEYDQGVREGIAEARRSRRWLRAGDELRSQLPALLWSSHLGVVLYWIHDTSPGCARTYRIVDRRVDPIARRAG